MSISSLRLITNEDIVGDITFDDSTNEYVVEEPAQLLIIPTKNSNQPSFGFVPYPIHADRGANYSLRFHKDHVIIKPIEIGNEFINQYRSMFGSGLITPKSNIVV
jgi:hypothetical protein